MNQRDRAFLVDMKDFISMNRLATVFALLQAGASPEMTTESTMRMLDDNPSEQPPIELTQANLGNVQGILAAKIFAERIAAYEDLAALGWAIRNRANGGVFARYLTNTTREAASFLQEIVDNDVAGHPEFSLDTLLRLPSPAQLAGRLPPEIHAQLGSYFQVIPSQLDLVARYYRMQASETQMITHEGQNPPEAGKHLAVILSLNPVNQVRPGRRVVSDTFNKIKHQFLVTTNLATYASLGDGYNLEYSSLGFEPSYVEDVIQGVISVTRVLRDFAAILLLLDYHGIDV